MKGLIDLVIDKALKNNKVGQSKVSEFDKIMKGLVDKDYEHERQRPNRA